jgi:primary-amine oxidase
MRYLRPSSGLVLLVGLLGLSRPVSADVPHRLDSLSVEEIARTVRILEAEGKADDQARYVQIALNEPPKSSAWDPSSRPSRESLAILIDRPGGSTIEAVVDLDAGQVRSWTKVARGKPPLFPGDYAATARIVRADPRFLEAIRRRGITDPEQVQVDAWAPGAGLPGGSRMARALFFLKPRGQAAYLRPIGNLMALVDLDGGRAIEVTDLGLLPIPPADPGFDVERTRPALAPLRIEQPRGVGFERIGQEIRWQGWRLRFSMHPRDGLILREVGIEEGGRLRPILYRGSLSELLVPYGDPARDWSFRNAFDEGEYGLGRFADSLAPGVDCPENATFADALLADESGTP